MKMNKELELLFEIKKNFGWFVDTFRYGLSGKSRFWTGKDYVKELPAGVVEKVRFSLAKVKIAKQHLGTLSRIPWVQMIFITGSVASLNADESDDIDIWIVVEPKRIWLTRTLDFLLYTFSGKRRLSTDGVNAERVRNKFCFNFYSSTDSLELTRHSISYAMQFVDAIPVFIKKGEMYKELLLQNIWIKEYFPSWYETTLLKLREIGHESNVIEASKNIVLTALEYTAGVLMILKSEKKLVLSPQKIFRKQFTTWGTPRILSQYDNKTISEGS